MNASWNLDVTEILKANQGDRATLLLSVPSVEANPLTKEYVYGGSSPGQYAPVLIIKYRTQHEAALGASEENDETVGATGDAAEETVEVATEETAENSTEAAANGESELVEHRE